MNYSSDWLLKLVEQYKEKMGTSPHFISDWDVSIKKATFPHTQINRSLINSQQNALKYLFSEDLLDTKKNIAKVFNNHNIPIETKHLVVAASATASIYSTIKALSNKGINRFLVFTPVYYTILETLKEVNATIIYYHLFDLDDFEIREEKVREIIELQNVESIIFSDCIYSAGIEVPINTYQILADLSIRYNLCVVCDYTLGGLEWDNYPPELISSKKISALTKAHKFIFIDSISKKLLTNGFKNSVVISNTEFTRSIEDYLSKTYGGLSSPQVEYLNELYSQRNANSLSKIIAKNIDRIKQNYSLLNSVLINSQYTLYDSNSGYFTMIIHHNYRTQDMDSKKIIEEFLFDEGMLALPAFHFSFHPKNRFGFRVNLLKDLSVILPILEKCIGKDTHRLNQGK